MLNPTNPAFSTVSLTAAINVIPNKYGRLGELNLFPYNGIRSRTVYVEEYRGTLTLLPTMPVGSPGTVGQSGKRKVRTFTVPHIPHDDSLMASEVHGVKAFGTDTLQTVPAALQTKLQAMRNKHAITLEHLRMGALKGIILDADGSTLYNLYTEFDIVPKSVDFLLGDSSTNVQGKCLEVVRHIEDNLKGDVMVNVHALVSQEFFDKLVSHANVKEVFQYSQAAVQRLAGDMRKSYTFGGITFEEYRAIVPDADENLRRFIEANEGHAFPLGTLESFQTNFAPADFIEAVNTIGLELYAKVEPSKFGKGIGIHTQSNPLPLCSRPGVLVKVYSSN